MTDSGVSISGTTLQIIQKDIVIEFVSDKFGKFIIRATLDEPILSDTNNKQGVSVVDQNFYLINKETPYRLNLVGTMSTKHYHVGSLTSLTSFSIISKPIVCMVCLAVGLFFSRIFFAISVRVVLSMC